MELAGCARISLWSLSMDTKKKIHARGTEKVQERRPNEIVLEK
jgi:hypothetical protein